MARQTLGDRRERCLKAVCLLMQRGDQRWLYMPAEYAGCGHEVIAGQLVRRYGPGSQSRLILTTASDSVVIWLLNL